MSKSFGCDTVPLRSPPNRTIVFRLVLCSLVLVIASTSTVPHVGAQAGPELLISPASQPLQSPCSYVNFDVEVSNIPTMGGWVVYVMSDCTVLCPVSISVGTFLPPP